VRNRSAGRGPGGSEESPVAGDLPGCAGGGQDRPQHHLIRLEDQQARLPFQLLDRAGGAKAVSGEDDGIGLVTDMPDDPVDDLAGLYLAWIVREPGRIASDTSNP
jgi:hypothetical protein